MHGHDILSQPSVIPQVPALELCGAGIKLPAGAIHGDILPDSDALTKPIEMRGESSSTDQVLEAVDDRSTSRTLG